jgi:hypothetical protein
MKKEEASTLFSNQPIFHQVNCEERRNGILDLSQTEAVLRYRPDIILLEYPTNQEPPNYEFNDYPPLEIPKELVEKRTREFPPELLKADPYVAADTLMWRNVAKLWSENHTLYAYPTDGPSELLGEWGEVWAHMYPQATHNWVWWVQIYLREVYMSEHIRYVMEKHRDLQQPTVCVFIQSFHWHHALFQIAHPTPDEIWHYYFGKFEHEVSREDIGGRIKKLNSVFYKHWQLKSHFAQ